MPVSCWWPLVSSESPLSSTSWTWPAPWSPWEWAEWSRASGWATAAEATANTSSGTPTAKAPPLKRSRSGSHSHNPASATSSSSNATQLPSTNETVSGWSACAPNGSPAVRLSAQTATRAAFTTTTERRTQRLGRATSATARASCSQAETRKPPPSRLDAPRCDGAMTTWTMPAAAENDARIQRFGRSSWTDGSTSIGGMCPPVSTVTAFVLPVGRPVTLVFAYRVQRV